MSHDRILILDFGSQVTQLIARRVREAHVYCEVHPNDVSAEFIREYNPKGIILSGSHMSAYEESNDQASQAVFEAGVPVLGICYGMQTMAQQLGGRVESGTKREFGYAEVRAHGHTKLLEGIEDFRTEEGHGMLKVWMSHGDKVAELPPGFKVMCSTPSCPIAGMCNEEKGFYAVQFHPEVTHTLKGREMLNRFVLDICKCSADWVMGDYVAEAVAQIREQVGDEEVILGLSGGVDSSVVAALGARAVGKQMTCVFINHGLLRKGEPEQVEEVFTKQFDVDFIHVHAEDRYAELLAGVTEPEEKRRIIGTQFWKEFFAVAQQLETDGKPVKYLAQGTIYPDIIESGARKTGGKTATIKSHHNLIPFPEGVHFDLIEPLDHFFKDEVRALGLALGLPGHIVFRQPFPGPGLAIRIIGAVDKEKLEILKNADAIVREELDAYNQRLFEQTGERNSEHSCWQYFAVLPDIKSVGVMGDERTYQRPIILRAVESSDAMTADWAKLPYDVLARISGRIVAEVPGANRVCYDITSKPPATIEWE